MNKISFYILSIVSLTVHNVSAQKINIGYIYPAGAQRGTTSTIEIGGQSIASASSVVVSGKGVTAEIVPMTEAERKAVMRSKKKKTISDEDNLQLAQTVKVRITVSSDAELGIRDLNIINAQGVASNRLFFEIGQYTEFNEKEPNNSLLTANRVVSLPVVVNGQVEKSAVNGSMETDGGNNPLELGGRDYYSFDARTGQTIVALVKARRLIPYLADAVPGWFQSVIALYDDSNKEVAYCDDYLGQPDPVMIYTIPKDGRYTLKIHDAIYRGRADFVYRIHLGEIPFVSSIFPLGGKCGQSTKIELNGANLDAHTMEVRLNKNSSGKQTIRYTNKAGISSNEILFMGSSDTEFILCTNPKQTKHTVRLSDGMAVNSRIDTPNKSDVYYIDVVKNESWIFEVMGRRLGSPIDAKIIIADSDGKLLTEIDDVEDQSEGMITHQSDPELLYKFPYAGRYYIKVSETQGKYGEDYSYRLRAFKAEPDFSLSIEPSGFSVPQNGTALFSVFANRKYNFKDPIAITIEGLPKGFTVQSNSMFSEHENIMRGKAPLRIAITATEGAKTGKLDIKVIGKAKSANSEEVIVREAHPVEQMTQAFYIDHLIPTDELRVTVTDSDPFTLSLDSPNGTPLQFAADTTIAVKVRINRKAGFNEPIQIVRKDVPKQIKFSSITIDGDKSEGTIYMQCTSWKPNTMIPIMVMGTVKASTVNRVAGQNRNTIYATTMVNSPYIRIKAPDIDPPNNNSDKKAIKIVKPK